MITQAIPHKALLAEFCAKFDILQRNVEEQVDYYNFQYESYGNEIYELPSTRLAHWWNYEGHNWFANRIDLYLDRVESMRDVLLIDVGFSIPYLDARPSLRGREDISAILVDNKQSAAEFYSLIRQVIEAPRASKDSIMIADIETAAAQSQIIATAKSMVEERKIERVLVAASEVVEHLHDPGRFWQFASALTKNLSVETTVYVTLPVAGPVPSHHLVFEEEPTAMSYLLNAFLLEEARILRPPRTEGWQKAIHRGCICAFGQMA